MIEYQVVHERYRSNGQWHIDSVLYTGADKQIAMITLMSAYKVLVASAKETGLDYARIRIIEQKD